MARRCSLLFVLLLWFALTASGLALEVRQMLWGFDGRVVPGRINPVSLLVVNSGNGPFDGELVLKQLGGLGGHSGAPYAQAAYLAPQSQRWVQFQVFVAAAGEEFSLTWGRGAKDHFELEPTVAGPPARVLLSDPDNPFGVSGAFKIFPDQLFPTTVAATDGLDAVVLDYVPRWEPARREAFMDWVRRGGIVLVLPAPGGEFPVFTEQLDALNITGDSGHVGAGTVLRAKVTRREVGEKLFAERGFPAPELKQNKSTVVYNFEQTVFDRLARLTRPNIRWWLINTLTLVYLLIVGPIHYRLGKRIDYRLSIAAFVGTVALFGWTFSVVGRRGYGESQTVNSLTIARALGGGRFDVTQWVSAFATRGDLYSLTHRAPTNLYAAVSQEAINGRIYNGKDGKFLADIPLYSSRQFVHRAAMPGADTSVTVESWENDSVLKKLVLKVGPEFPKEAADLRVWYRERFYALKREGDRLMLAGDSGQNYEAFLPQNKVQETTYNYQNQVVVIGPDDDGSKKRGEDLRASLPLLYVRALDGRDYFNQQITHPELPADRLQLYIFAPAPESFAMQGKGFGKETGYVLYVQDVFKSTP